MPVTDHLRGRVGALGPVRNLDLDCVVEARRLSAADRSGKFLGIHMIEMIDSDGDLEVASRNSEMSVLMRANAVQVFLI